MSEKKRVFPDPRTEELLKAFERERDAAHDLNRQHTETMRDAQERDRQVLIERRRKPRL
jgi:hypothetical protein